MSFLVWSYSKDLLHHAALKFNLVVGRFQGEKKIIIWFLPSHAKQLTDSMDAIVTAQNMII